MTNDDNINAEMAHLFWLQAAALRLVLAEWSARDEATPVLPEVPEVDLVLKDTDEVDDVLAGMPAEDLKTVIFHLTGWLADVWSTTKPRPDPAKVRRNVERSIAEALDAAERWRP